MKENHQAKLAVLIDADNTSASAIEGIMAEIAKHGIASAKRIYGDWSSPHLQSWKNELLKYALVPVQQFAYTTGKDTTDMQLIIDGMDLLYSGTYDGFCILSSDSDFTPLAMRIRESGLAVYGFGRKKTPEAFRHACDRFFYIENLLETAENNSADDIKETTVKTVRHAIEGTLQQLLFKAVKETTDDSTGWAFVGSIGSYLIQTQSDFDPRTYGYAKLSNMLKELGSMQFKYDGESRMYCRKIPYSDLVKVLAEAIKKFGNKDGWAKISVVEKYVKPRWDYTDFGFEDFDNVLENVHNLSIKSDSIKILPNRGKS